MSPLQIHREPIIEWLSPSASVYQFSPATNNKGTSSLELSVFVTFGVPSGGPTTQVSDIGIWLWQEGMAAPVSIPSSSISLGPASPYWPTGELSWVQNTQPTFNLYYAVTDASGSTTYSGALASFPGMDQTNTRVPASFFVLQPPGAPPPSLGGLQGPELYSAYGNWNPSDVRGFLLGWVSIANGFGG